MRDLPGVIVLIATATIPAIAGDEQARSASAAQHPMERQFVERQVFDLQGSRVGDLYAYIEANGTPAAIVSASKAFGGPQHRLLVPADALGKGSDGGLLLALSDLSVSDLPRYVPGRPLPIW